tara:strand:+ start:756 stop:923 length:168 start_codon:yes stop_codon:yes gene_type:complete
MSAIKKIPENSESKEKSEDWDRFERAVDIALHTPAKHKAAIAKKPKLKPKKKPAN